MAKTLSKLTRPIGESIKIIIPSELEQKLESIPDKKEGVFTALEIEIIKKYGGKKAFKDIAKIIGRSESAVRRRYNELQ